MNLLEKSKKLVQAVHPVVLVLSLVSIIFLVLISAKISRYIINPDGISYISLANHYASGYFGDAINAYWSPMIVWLMVPFVSIDISGQSAFAIVNLLVATAILVVGTTFAGKLNKKNRVLLRVVYIFSITPFLGYALIESITPDLLVVLWVLLFVVILTSFYKKASGATKIDRGLIAWLALIGALGAIGYFIKLYLLFFFVPTIFILWTIYFINLENNKNQIKLFCATGLLVYVFFAVFILPWALVLSAKYDKVTLGSAFSVNTGVSDSGDFRQPQTYQLLPLPNSHAITAWEDPTVIDYGRSSALESGSNIKKKLQTSISAGLPKALNTEFNISIAILPIALLGFLLLLMKKIQKNKEVLVISLVAGVVYTGGYILAGGGGNARYHWPAYILSVIIFVVLIANVPARLLRKKAFLAAIFCVPLVTIIQLGPDRVHRTQQIIKKHNSLVSIASRLHAREIILPNSKIAGQSFHFISYVAYYSNTKSIGVIDGRSGESFGDYSVKERMKRLGGEYYVVVSPMDTDDPYNFVGAFAIADSHCVPPTESCSFNVYRVE